MKGENGDAKTRIVDFHRVGGGGENYSRTVATELFWYY